MRLHGDMSKNEIKQADFIKGLPYDELVLAHKLIDRGASVGLVYFWYNLLKCSYHPTFKVSQVMSDVLEMCKKHPEFEADIVQWFREYDEKIKKL